MNRFISSLIRHDIFGIPTAERASAALVCALYLSNAFRGGHLGGVYARLMHQGFFHLCRCHSNPPNQEIIYTWDCRWVSLTSPLHRRQLRSCPRGAEAQTCGCSSSKAMGLWPNASRCWPTVGRVCSLAELLSPWCGQHVLNMCVNWPWMKPRLQTCTHAYGYRLGKRWRNVEM